MQNITQVLNKKNWEVILKSNNNKFISYVNNSSTYTKYIPQHLQRMLIKNFSEKYKYKLQNEFLEYNNMSHLPVLLSLISKKKQKNIIIFSIHSLSVNRKIVKKIFQLALKNKKNFFFANEELSTLNKKEFKLIKKITSHKSFIN